MKLFSSANASSSRVLILALLLAITYVSSTSTAVEARPAPNLGQRRLLNLSGNGEPAEIPAMLTVSDGHNLAKYYKAAGFQEYVFEGTTWKLTNASANLTSFAGHEVGVHYYSLLTGLPTWESFSPQSFVTGQFVYNVSMSSSSIPWVLVETTKTSGSPSQFGAVTFIQRLFTSGGLPPDSTYPASIGDIYRSSYTANYAFYTGDR